MKITAIGVGSAFSNVNYNSSFLLEDVEYSRNLDPDKFNADEGTPRRMLVDCGFQIPAALHKQSIDLKSINDIYISHAHADHIGGLEAVAFQRYDWARRTKHFSQRSGDRAPRLIANVHLMADLWEKSLKGGLESLEGIDATLETYFEALSIPANETFEWCRWTCQLIQQVHIMTGSIISNTFGLVMRKAGHKTIYFTTDSQHCSPRQVEIFYRDADVIFQDCEVLGVDTDTRTSKFMSNVHANYAQLAGNYAGLNSIELPPQIRSKMHLTHYQDCVSAKKDFFGNACDWDERVALDGFAGLCKVGATYTV